MVFTWFLAPYRSVAYRALLKIHLSLLDTVWRARPPLWVYKRLDVVRDYNRLAQPLKHAAPDGFFG